MFTMFHFCCCCGCRHVLAALAPKTPKTLPPPLSHPVILVFPALLACPDSSDSFNVAVESTSVTNNNILSFLDSAVEVPVERVYRLERDYVSYLL